MKSYLKSLKPNSQKLRAMQTEVETQLWYRIRGDQLGLRFYRQRLLLTYIVDFYCPKVKLVIELDGGQHYELNIRRMIKFVIRNCRVLGLTVLRFDNYCVMTEIDRSESGVRE